MPLPEPQDRELIHTRTFTFKGYRRTDGLWDVDGRMTDVKTHDFPCKDRNGLIPAGENFHDISIRLTIDEDMKIVDVAACIDAGPFRTCHKIAPAFKKLVGVRIARGFRHKVAEMFAGVKGCTHMVEIVNTMASAAYQALWPVRNKKRDPKKRPPLLNSCFAFDSRGESVKEHFPDWYDGE